MRVVGDFTGLPSSKDRLKASIRCVFGFQPVTDDHQGTTPYPEFLLLSPAAEDAKPDPMEHKALEELSIKATGGKHPAVFLLFPGKNTSDEPKLVEKGGGCWVLMVKQDVRVGDKKTVMGVGLTLIGTSLKAAGQAVTAGLGRTPFTSGRAPFQRNAVPADRIAGSGRSPLAAESAPPLHRAALFLSLSPGPSTGAGLKPKEARA